jgi:hypothetical protein
VRADSGFAVPARYDYLEEEGIAYTLGLAGNDRRAALAAPLAAEAACARAETGEKVRLFAETSYQADSWGHPRRVIIKAEVLDKGLNLRYVVTSRRDTPEGLYTWYTRRGDRPDLCIKDLKEGCYADRLSDRRCWPNQFRLLRHAAAYWLLDTLRLRLIKIGGWVRRCLDGLSLHLASSHPGAALWHLLATRPGRP